MAVSNNSINPSNAMETWYGIIRSLDDALRLVEAARTGLLPRVTRRLTDDERANLIRSGSVFIFEETEAQVRRWADSRLWSSSRMKGHFLLYTQLAHDPASGSMSSSTPPLVSPSSSRRPSDTSVTTTASSPTMLDDKNGTPPPPPGTIALGDSDDNDDVCSGSGAPTAVGSNVAGVSGTRTAFKKRALSLSTAFGQKLRLISYYTEADAAAGNLRTIDQDERLANLPVPENLYYAANDTPVALSRRSATRMPTISGPVLAPQAASMPPSVVAGHGFHSASHHDLHHLHHQQSVPPQLVQAQAQAQHHVQAQAYSQPHHQQRQVPAPIAVGTMHLGQPQHAPSPPASNQEYLPHAPSTYPQPQGPSPTSSYPPLHSHAQTHPHQPAHPAHHGYGASPPPPPGPLASRRPSYSPTRPSAHPYARRASGMTSPEHSKAMTYPPVAGPSARHSWGQLDSPPPGLLPHPTSRGTRSRSGSASSMIHTQYPAMAVPSPTSPGHSFPPPTTTAAMTRGVDAQGSLVLPPIRTLSPTWDGAGVVPAGQGLPDVPSEARELAKAHPDMRYAGLATSEDKRQLRALDQWSSEHKWRTF